MNDDLISRSALKKVFENLASDDYNEPIWYQQTVFETIDNAPTVDTDLSKYSDKLWETAYDRGKKERPHGKWLTTWEKNIFSCSYCHGVSGKYNFCPNCGADMRE